ncbi:unnamed protein product [Amoebophrya sp. A25]|nr:unnamed protein product [Amoebophrya sp. A25]|eukprot:GSA25T00018148001.1
MPSKEKEEKEPGKEKAKHEKWEGKQKEDWDTSRGGDSSSKHKSSKQDWGDSTKQKSSSSWDMRQVLMVAEKPTIAEAIATALAANPKDIQKSKRISPVCPIFEFEGYAPFIKKGREKVWMKVTSTVGHIYGLEFQKQYLDWKTVAPVDLFDAGTEQLEAKGSNKVPGHLRQEAKYCSHLVLWLDCDREGENICFEVMKSACCSEKEKEEGSKLIPRKNAFRALFSALDAKSLEKAFWELNYDGPNKNESDAVDARQEMDLKVGVAWTRYQTMFYQGRYRDLDAKLLSYGPCQTPTLWFCVQRHDQIKAFKPEKFWVMVLKIKVRSLLEEVKKFTKALDPDCKQPKSQLLKKKFDSFTQRQQEQQARSNGLASSMPDETLEIEWTRGPIFNYEAMTGMKQMLVAGASSSSSSGAGSNATSSAPTGLHEFRLEVTKQASKEMRYERPQGMNTVTMLKLASSNLGIGPQEAMREAEHLYLRGYLTYPRTETTAYPKTLDLDGLLRAQTTNPVWGSQAKDLVTRGRKAPRKGFDAGDHPPLTPTLQVPSSVEELGGTRAWRVYELVCRNFMASISSDLLFLSAKLQLSLYSAQALQSTPSGNTDEMPKFHFTLSDKKLQDPGFQRVMKPNFDEEAYRLEFNNGTPYDIGDHLNLYDRYRMRYNPSIDDDMHRRSGRKRIENDIILELKEQETSAPDYLTESDLLGLMDANGIGTDASMANHINTICERNYVDIAGGRKLVPTKVGISLVHGYSLVDNELCVPKMRQDMEAACTLIAKGEAKRKDVVAHMLNTYKSKFAFFTEHQENLMDQLFQKEYELAVPGSIIGSSADKMGKGGKAAIPSTDELRELQRLGLDKGDFGGKLGEKGKGGKSKGKGKSRGKDEEGKGKGKGRKKGRDDEDFVGRDEQQYLVQSGGYNAMATASTGSTGGGGIVIVSAKEKKIKELEKKIKEITRLEQDAEDGKKVLDAAQKKKIDSKAGLQDELKQLLNKFSN